MSTTHSLDHVPSHEAGMLAATSRHEHDARDVEQLTLELGKQLQVLRGVFRSRKTTSYEWRMQQLKSFRQGLIAEKDRIVECMQKDLGRPAMEAVFAEFTPVVGELDHCMENLESWMKMESVDHPMMFWPGKSEIRPQPKGVVLILTPWNYPINLSFMCMIGAIVAGNCFVLKPSEVAPASAEFLEDFCNKYLDTDCVKVVQGAVAETTALLNLKWDHIVYTGNGAVGRIVAKAAAKYLTPITLELGGKSPCYIDESVKMDVGVKRVLNGKFINCSQTCVSVDYILLHEKIADEFLRKAKETLVKFFGTDIQKSTSLGRIVNERHWDRIMRLLDPTSHGGQIIYGGPETADRSDKFIPPSLIVNPDLESPLMREEIFGPLLPIIIVKDKEEAAEFINAREHPLALYCFAEDSSTVDYVVDNTTAGGVCVNDILYQVASPTIPFGGVGASGIGSYHGYFSFKEFSHFKPVMHKSTWLDPGVRYPPYSPSGPQKIAEFVSKEPMSRAKKNAIAAGVASLLGLAVLSRL